MTDISRWLPFKWRRKTAEQKKEEAPAPRAEVVPTEASHAMSLFSPSMQQMMQRMFDEPFFADPFARAGDLDRWFGDFSPSRFRPSVDVVDEEGALRVTAELPGMEKDDVKLSIDDGMLTIRGEKRNEEESREQGVFRSERFYGYVNRSIPLPSDLDLDKTEAKFKNGVLTVRMPKGRPKPEGGHQIPIKS